MEVGIKAKVMAILLAFLHVNLYPDLSFLSAIGPMSRFSTVDPLSGLYISQTGTHAVQKFIVMTSYTLWPWIVELRPTRKVQEVKDSTDHVKSLQIIMLPLNNFEISEDLRVDFPEVENKYSGFHSLQMSIDEKRREAHTQALDFRRRHAPRVWNYLLLWTTRWHFNVGVP